MMGHSPTHMHMNVTNFFANIVALESIPKITQGLKVLDMCKLVINPNMAILI